MKYNAEIMNIKYQDETQSQLLMDCRQVIDRCKTSRFEAFIVMIVFHNKSRDKLKAIEKAEKEYALTKQNPHTTVHAGLWKAVLEVKRLG